VARVPGVSESRIEDHLLTCAVHGSVAPLLDVLSPADVIELDSHEMSLEEVFLGELDQTPSATQPAAGRVPAQPAAGR
jgi:hypothetical protein